MFNSGLASVIKPFSSWTGGLNDNRDLHPNRNILDKIREDFDALGATLGYGSPL